MDDSSTMESGAQPMVPPQRTLSRKRKIQCTALFIVLLLILCELAVRIRSRVKHGNAHVGTSNELLVLDEKLDMRIPQPGFETQGSSSSIKINSLGFRGEEITVDKPPGTIRVACLGAS